MEYTRIFLFGILCCSLSFCSSIKSNESSIKQGVFGKVIWMQGNFMPSPDRSPQKESTPAIRIVYLYTITNLNEIEGEAPLFSSIKKTIVAKVKTNKDGYFQCKLSPGRYSIFTLEEDGKFFANVFDGEGNITPFEVKKGEVTTYTVQVNYKAAF